MSKLERKGDDLLEQRMTAEIQKLYPGLNLTQSQSIPLNDKTAKDIGDIKLTLSSLFNLNSGGAFEMQTALILIQFRDQFYCVCCRLTARLCDVSNGLTNIMREKLKELTEENEDILFHLRYSIVEFRIILTNTLSHLKPVVWLRADEPDYCLEKKEKTIHIETVF